MILTRTVIPIVAATPTRTAIRIRYVPHAFMHHVVHANLITRHPRTHKQTCFSFSEGRRLGRKRRRFRLGRRGGRPVRPTQGPCPLAQEEHCRQGKGRQGQGSSRQIAKASQGCHDRSHVCHQITPPRRVLDAVLVEQEGQGTRGVSW